MVLVVRVVISLSTIILWHFTEKLGAVNTATYVLKFYEDSRGKIFEHISVWEYQVSMIFEVVKHKHNPCGKYSSDGRFTNIIKMGKSQ